MSDDQIRRYGPTRSRNKPDPPSPKCGQVWAWPDGTERLVTSILRRADGARVARFGRKVYPWPPAGAVLVAGPGAPWAPS